jgi:hypothetical protein
MDGLRVLSQQRFGFFAGHLQPERIGTKINLVVSKQFAKITDARLAEIFVAVPKSKNTRARFGRKIHFAFRAVIETQPDAVVFQNFDSGDFFHHTFSLQQFIFAEKSFLI